MTKKSKLIFISLMIIFYTIVLGMFGVFGDTIQTYLINGIKFILPKLAILVGYVFCVILPFRVASALRKNKERLEEYEKNAKLDNIVKTKKSFNQKILETLSKEESL